MLQESPCRAHLGPRFCAGNGIRKSCRHVCSCSISTAPGQVKNLCDGLHSTLCTIHTHKLPEHLSTQMSGASCLSRPDLVQPCTSKGAASQQIALANSALSSTSKAQILLCANAGNCHPWSCRRGSHALRRSCAAVQTTRLVRIGHQNLAAKGMLLSFIRFHMHDTRVPPPRCSLSSWTDGCKLCNPCMSAHGFTYLQWACRCIRR